MPSLLREKNNQTTKTRRHEERHEGGREKKRAGLFRFTRGQNRLKNLQGERNICVHSSGNQRRFIDEYFFAWVAALSILASAIASGAASSPKLAKFEAVASGTLSLASSFADCTDLSCPRAMDASVFNSLARFLET